MTSQVNLIVQLPRGGAIDRYFRAEPPPSLASGRVVLEHLQEPEGGQLPPLPAGEVVMSVPSPEALVREQQEVREVLRHPDAGDEPLVIIVAAAEELREDELGVVLAAAARARRPVILRVMADVTDDTPAP